MPITRALPREVLASSPKVLHWQQHRTISHAWHCLAVRQSPFLLDEGKPTPPPPPPESSSSSSSPEKVKSSYSKAQEYSVAKSLQRRERYYEARDGTLEQATGMKGAGTFNQTAAAQQASPDTKAVATQAAPPIDSVESLVREGKRRVQEFLDTPVYVPPKRTRQNEQEVDKNLVGLLGFSGVCFLSGFIITPIGLELKMFSGLIFSGTIARYFPDTVPLWLILMCFVGWRMSFPTWGRGWFFEEYQPQVHAR